MKKLGMIAFFSMCIAASAGGQGKSADTIPTAYKPPKGMCRIWLKDVPPAQQPAPTDCAAAVKNAPSNGRVVFGDTEDTKTKTVKTDPKKLPDAKALTGTGTTPPILPRKPPG